jgi:hypothetical protein
MAQAQKPPTSLQSEEVALDKIHTNCRLFRQIAMLNSNSSLPALL